MSAYFSPPPASYYSGLLTSEYQNSTKLLAWLAAPLSILNDVTACLAAFDEAFDLDEAIGPQLDILGEIIGAQRLVPFQPSGGVSPLLDDPTYLIYLKARIAQNQWTGTIDSLQAIWRTLFPGGTIVIEDNQNMTVNIILAGAFTSILQDLITHGLIVPRPQGVLYNYSFSMLPIFGFDSQNSLISGFDQGHFA
jgi:hypothetical protein